jgi:hypothetical protein
LRLAYRSINAVWEESRKLGVLTLLYEGRVDDWRLLKCARAYAKHVGEVRNAKLVRLLERVFAWIRARMSHAYRRARSRLKELSQARKFRIGVWGSAGLRGDLLHFYLSVKNGSAPAGLLIDLYG